MVSYRTWLIVWLMCMAGLTGFSQQVRIIKYPELHQLLSGAGDSVLVVNFWATWCKPCVAELPYFEQLSSSRAKDKIKVILINLDGVSKAETNVKPFLVKRGIKKATVFLLNEPNYNSWIDKVSTDWSGALPFTLLIDSRRKQRKAFERAFTESELTAELNSFLHESVR